LQLVYFSLPGVGIRTDKVTDVLNGILVQHREDVLAAFDSDELRLGDRVGRGLRMATQPENSTLGSCAAVEPQM
jgi:hypothetical protein